MLWRATPSSGLDLSGGDGLNMDGGLYMLVYDYYETQIQYGYYKYGDYLPSIQTIQGVGTMFQMAPATIRNALALLEKNGFIEVEPRKGARVTYKATAAQIRERAANDYVPKLEGFLDLYRSGPVLFEPLWEAGLRSSTDLDWKFARQLVNPVSLPLELYLMVYGALDNGLILNLYWETIRYMRFPYLMNREESRRGLQALETLPEEEWISFLRRYLSQSYRQAMHFMRLFIEESRVEFSLEKAEAIPFTWSIYRQRPQLRYTLSSRIIREIINGRYPVGKYLPSFAQLAEQYGVAKNTVRRAIDTLNSFGVTRPYHGKGILVCMEHFQIDYDKPEIREGLRLFQESQQLLALTIRSVSLFTLESVTEEKREHLTKKLLRLWEEGREILCFEICLDFIEEQCPLDIVRKIYRKIHELLLWGYPAALLRMGKHGLRGEHPVLIEQAKIQLREGNLSGFADTWQELMHEEHSRFTCFLAEIKETSGD